MKTNNPILSHALRLCFLLLLLLNIPELYAQRPQSLSPHGDMKIDIACSNCHTSDAWVPARDDMEFNHNTQTRFSLLGRHSIAECRSCHLDLDFTEPVISGEGCESCHVDVHRGAFSQSCTGCHNLESFTEVEGVFIHNQTAFPLTGAHQQIECQSCHSNQANGHFTTLDTECYDCHEKDYVAARTVDHVESGFPYTCEDCHTTLAWQPAFFDHLTASGGFALLGAHGMVDCASCHRIPSMDLIYTASSDQDCYACHSDDYNDEHAGSGFPTDCRACHNVNSWGDADFDHVGVSGGFELLGAHNKTDCSSCHTADMRLVFNPPPADQNDCYTCHTEDYIREHEGSGFPTDCSSCHNVNTWEDADFEHASVSAGFELLGAHVALDCASCHTPGMGLVFDPAPANQDDCYTCHTDDYNREHAGTGFPTDCSTCHTVDTWEDAEFTDHDKLYFPIFSGEHRGEWNDNCQTCHTVPADFSQFTCLDCHEHNQSDMNSEHDDVSGYVYESSACYSCHPNGTGDDD